MKMEKPIPPVPPEDCRITACINVKLAGVVYIGNGVYQLELPGREIRPEDREVIRRLLPNTLEQFYDLLNKENLLAAMYDGEISESQYADRQRFNHRDNRS